MEVRCFLLIGSRFETITHFFWTGSEIKKEETPDGGDGTVCPSKGAYLGRLPGAVHEADLTLS